MRKPVMMVFSFLLMFQLLFTAVPTLSFACSCVQPGPPQEALEKAGAVFSGKVTKVTKTREFINVEFEVNTAWKGVSDRTLTVLTSIGGEVSCGFDFKTGKEYLVYASKMNSGALEASFCSRTRLLDSASSDLQELGSGTTFDRPQIEQQVTPDPSAAELKQEPKKESKQEPKKEKKEMTWFVKTVWIVIGALFLTVLVVGLIRMNRR
ncbi:hypothetical protein CIG75_15725 [Tumebacillus algifaecis]|uniref:Tissue inhibitor of metalloproteinase n=1 Tax=Tumebacillus algifaecis TaxID=1214604 RepID=A0A223D3P1_9BACL|nr:hypothetical protein [Tumebacillus algifaecis]ASS76248.1 hypothetical protein CIG75_15725 [Tumebacillus algifaecis]